MASHDVFISYPSQDKVSADAVCHGLEARGVRCWIAPRDVIPGSDWQTSLLDAISDAKATVLVFTSHTNSSDHIKREITAAFEGGAVVIPFRLENVTPQGALRYHLTGVHWLDAFSGELEPHIEQLASTIKRVLARPVPESGVVVTPEIGPGAQPTHQPAAPMVAAPVAPVAAAAIPPAAAAVTPPKAAATTILSKPATPPPSSAPPRPSAPPPTAKRKGGVQPWMIGAGIAAVVVLGIIAIGLAGSGGEDAAADPAAAAAELRQQGVEIGVQSQPEPTGSDTPVPTLDGPVQPAAPDPAAPVEPPLAEDPGFDSGYVEEPVAEPPAEEGAKPVE